MKKKNRFVHACCKLCKISKELLWNSFTNTWNVHSKSWVCFYQCNSVEKSQYFSVMKDSCLDCQWKTVIYGMYYVVENIITFLWCTFWVRHVECWCSNWFEDLVYDIEDFRYEEKNVDGVVFDGCHFMKCIVIALSRHWHERFY